MENPKIMSIAVMKVEQKALCDSWVNSKICVYTNMILMCRNPYKKSPNILVVIYSPNRVKYEAIIYVGMMMFMLPFLPNFSGSINKTIPKANPMK